MWDFCKKRCFSASLLDKPCWSPWELLGFPALEYPDQDSGLALLSAGSWTWEGLSQKEAQEAGPELRWPLAQLSAGTALPGCPWGSALALPLLQSWSQLWSLAPQPLLPRVGHARSTYCSGALEGLPSFGIIRLLPWCLGCRSCTIKGVLLYVQSLLAFICSFHLVSINERANNSRD